MGTFLGSCVSGVAFGCFNCCLKEVGVCCGGLIGRERLAKLLYVFLDILVIVPAIFIFFYIQSWAWFVQHFSQWIHCPTQSGGNLNCFGTSSVFRLSMALLMLYSLILLFMVCRNRVSRVINQGLFVVKYLLVIGGFVGLLFVQNSVFEGYSKVCQIMGLVFLVLQSIILIDLFYLWGIKWIREYAAGKTQYAFLLIVFSVILYGGAVTLNIFSYINFRHCQIWPSVITSVLIVLIPCTQFLNFNMQNSLLTTSVICLYLSYLNFISLYSNPSCHALSNSAMATDITTSCLLFFLTMFGSVMGGSGVIKTASNTNLNETLGISTEQKQPQEEALVQHDGTAPPLNLASAGEDSYEGWGWVKWHIYMCIGSMYFAMMITNWGSPKINSPILGAYQSNWFAYWSRQGLQWATALLYVWTLVAPRLFPDRNFVIE